MRHHMKIRCIACATLLLIGCGVTAAQPPDERSQDGRRPNAGDERGGAPADAGGRQPGGARLMLMDVLDADRNGELSAEEIAGAEAALKRIDRDSDGRLTAGELSRSSLNPTGSDATGHHSARGNPESPTQAPGQRRPQAAGGNAGFGGGLIPFLGSQALHEELNLTEEQSTRLRKPAAR